MDRLLERDIYLQGLTARLEEARHGRGALVFVGGEAGVGKTSLARWVCDLMQDQARIAWGACEPLSTPGALGPVLEIAQALDEEAAQLLENGERRPRAFRLLLDALSARAKPTFLVLEDLHWADEATLDFVRFAGRRIAGTRALAIATYRDDEVGPDHPVRILLGDLATAEGVHRLSLPPLTEAAVRVLAEGSGLDPAALHRRTGGNPFFVTEVLASREPGMPATVVDAILARASRLSGPARAVLEACAVIGLRVEPWLLERAASPPAGAVDECLSRGVLQAEGALLAFRHELAREAIVRTLSLPRARDLHRAILEALRASPLAGSDPARLAHHAEAADDRDAVLHYAPEAARRAAALGAHREAAEQYARALRFADELPLEARAELLEALAYQYFLIARFDKAVETHERALECRRSLADPRREGDALRALSRMLWCAGRIVEAESRAREAVTLLEPLGASHELAMAYSAMTSVCMNAEDAPGALSWGGRALELAQRLDDPEVVIHALNSIGTMELLRGQPEGREKLERSMALAHEAGFQEHVGRAFIHFGWTAARTRRFDLAGQIAAGLEYATERDLYLWRLWLVAYRSRLELDQGRWTEAADSAVSIVRYAQQVTIQRIPALTVLALVRARRGDSDVWPLLDEAWALARPTGQLQHLAPVAAAAAEAAWLTGNPGAIDAQTSETFELARKAGDPWTMGELAYWRWHAGLVREPPPGAAEPYALAIAGAWRDAAERWRDMGCPYETALAFAQSDEADVLRQALVMFEQLGARTMVTGVARRLREMGVRGIPRGPRPATRAHPAGLTAREAEVLTLLAEGLAYADIGHRLHLSTRTVEHHVSAVLSKLEVRTRAEAVREAGRRGLIGARA